MKSAEALILFLEHQASIDDEQTKVTIRFACHNVYPKAFVAKKGKHKGQSMVYLSAQLSYLFTMKVNGQVIFGERATRSARQM